MATKGSPGEKIILKQISRQTDFTKAYDIFAELYPDRDFEDFEKRWNNDQTHLYLVYRYKILCGAVLITTRNEIGYFISKKYQGKGIGKKAIIELMRIEPRPYYWCTIPKENEASMLFIQSLHFVPRGIMYAKENN